MSERFAHKKSLGQHFLNNPTIPRRMCDAAKLAAGETVVEIGPGTGALTAELLQRGAIVHAIETDARAVEVLHERFADEIMAKKLVILERDVRTLATSELALPDHGFKVVANIPYYLSGQLFRTFLDTPCQPSDLVFLVQREVAERIAREKKSSLLSLSVATFGTPSYICTVKRGNFTPPPAVDSAIIAVHNIHRDHFATLSQEHFFTLLHLGFGQKRKQLLGNLAGQYDRTHLEVVFTQLELPLTIRAEDLTLTTWLALANALVTKSPLL